jgi:hypothetical protein
MTAWLKSLDRNEVTYWLGLLLLFAGLAVRVSVETALIVVGAVLAVESVISSYMATWMGIVMSHQRKPK